MSVQFDLVGFTTTTTGTGTTIAVGAAIPDSGLRTLAGAGIADGTIVSYALVTGTGSGTQRETGTATVASSGTQLTGRTLVSSTTGSLISLTGTSTVMLGPNRADLGRDGIEMATARLLGRSTAGTGAVEEITLGTNLSFTGTTLNAAGGGGSPGGSDGQIQRNNAGVLAGSNISQDAAGRITVAAGTQTAAGSALNLSYTANNSGAAISGLTSDMTNTASAATSRHFDFRLGGNSVVYATRDGTIGLQQQTGAGSYLVGMGVYAYIGLAFYGNGLSAPSVMVNAAVNHRIQIRSGASYAISSDATFPESAPDVAFGRTSAGVGEINNGTNGTLRDLRLRNLIASQVIQTQALTVATLPAAASWAGGEAYVTDASSPVIGSTVAGGGSARAVVRSNGTNWIVTSII